MKLSDLKVKINLIKNEKTHFESLLKNPYHLYWVQLVTKPIKTAVTVRFRPDQVQQDKCFSKQNKNGNEVGKK